MIKQEPKPSIECCFCRKDLEKEEEYLMMISSGLLVCCNCFRDRIEAFGIQIDVRKILKK